MDDLFDLDLDLEVKGEHQIEHDYKPAPTIEKFHASDATIRSIVGPAGSGKSTGAIWELVYYLPQYLFAAYGIRNTRWVVLRNTNDQLWTTTIKSFFEWFPPTVFGKFRKQEKTFNITAFRGLDIEVLFRSCDRPDDVDKFRGLEITGYLIDESSEVHHDIKLILRQRIGRFPKAAYWPKDEETGEPIVRRYGIEITNPPDIESTDYKEFYGAPEERLENGEGFWQVPGENKENLAANYYEEMRKMYAHDPEWIERYIEGKPGVQKVGKDVYGGFSHSFHVAKERLVWPGKNFTIYRGWDNTGTHPACVAAYMPSPGIVHVLREFWDDRAGVVEFTKRVQRECNAIFPDASFVDWADPAGEAKFSKYNGGLTSNAQLMRDEGVDVRPSSTNDIGPRIESVSILLGGNSRGMPHLLIDPSCNRLIQGFAGGYGFKEVQNGVFSQTPHKNRFADIHDGLQYLCVKLVGIQKARKRATSRKRPAHRARTMSGYGG